MHIVDVLCLIIIVILEFVVIVIITRIIANITIKFQLMQSRFHILFFFTSDYDMNV